MPRHPTHRHVLRDLIETIRKTQSEFAQMIGVETITVNRIVNGSLKISDDLAIRIHVATGIDIQELRKGSKGRLIEYCRGEYSAESFVR